MAYQENGRTASGALIGDTLRAFGIGIAASAVTLAWLLAGVTAYFLLDEPWRWFALGLLGAVAITSGWVLPAVTPFVADTRRGMKKRIVRRQRRAGYRTARDLALVPQIEAEELAVKRAGKYLPNARFMDNGESATFEVSQLLPATDQQILTRAAALAPTLGYPAEFITLDRPTPQQVLVTWRQQLPPDPLATVTPWPGITVDAGAPVPIGMKEDGNPFLLNVFGRQTLLVGSSGSGKASVIWSTVLPLATAIREGRIGLFGIDLKGGTEYQPAAELFTHIARTFEDAAKMIHGLTHTVLEPRLDYMREHGLRLHEPTTEEPLILVVIDEASSLMWLAPDPKARNAVDADMKRLLSTARAAGIAVLSSLQDPRKESLSFRDLFTQTCALRFRTKDDATLALGASAYEAGAHADRIPASQPGTGFMSDGDTGEVVKFRAYWVDDQRLREVAANNPAPRNAAQGGNSYEYN